LVGFAEHNERGDLHCGVESRERFFEYVWKATKYGVDGGGWLMSSVMRFDEWQDSNGNPVASAPNGVGAFNAREIITATNASWPVPTLGSPIVKVTVIGGGGGGGGAGDASSTAGGDGGTTTFNASTAGTVTASGGKGGYAGTGSNAGAAATLGNASANAGGGATRLAAGGNYGGANGLGGAKTVSYLDLTGISTVNVTIGAGGTAGTFTGNGSNGAAGGRGEVIVEYVAG